MLRELRGALTALALVVCLVLAAASFDVGIPGQSLLQTLRFHIAAGLGALVVLLLASGAWWRAVILLLPLIASVGQGASIIMRQQDARTALVAAGSAPLFKLLSFNLLNSNTDNGERIADYVIASGADVVMLMEALPLGAHRDRLIAAYPHYAACSGGSNCDTVLLSKVPLRNVVVGRLSTVFANRLVTAEADFGGTTVNLVLAHMVKPYYDDFAADEAYRLAEVMQRLQGPLVVAGDFNAAAWSANIDRLAQWQSLAPGPAYPATWPVELGPLGLPIDNVFTRAPLVVRSVEAIPDAMGSNHRGLIAEIGLASGG